jgi:hypothetical protein
MKNQLIIASAALLLGTFACKKNETSSPLKQQSIEANPPANEVKQKMYDLPAEVITEAVRNFKGINTLHTSNESSNQRISSFDVQSDSSIWILEAALNYDFDEIPVGSETSNDSCAYETNCSNNIVASSDLTAAYNYFNQYINQKTSGTDKVKIIDITAYLNNSKITYVANITYFSDLAQRTEGLCDPYRSSYQANWSNAWMTTYNCTFNSSNDGPTACKAKLNCNIAIGGCSGFYWANVTTVQLGTSYWTGLYSYSNVPSVCNQSLLSGTDINSRVTWTQGYGAANVPSSPSGMHVAGYNVIGRCFPGAVPYTFNIWWQLDITYGTYGCGGTPD